MRKNQSISRKNHGGKNRYKVVNKQINVYRPTYNIGSFNKCTNDKSVFDNKKIVMPEKEKSAIPKDWLWQLFLAILPIGLSVGLSKIIKLIMAYLF